MAESQAQNPNDPRYRTQITLKRLKEEMDRLRADINDVDEREFKATTETAAEVLAGLVKAFQNYEKRIWGV